MNSTDRLTRNQADLAVRHLTGRFYDEHGVNNWERLDDFARRLSWQIGGGSSVEFRDHLVDLLDALYCLDHIQRTGAFQERAERHEADLNFAVNGALGAAGFDGWINREPDPKPARYNLPGHEQTAAKFNALVRAGRFTR